MEHNTEDNKRKQLVLSLIKLSSCSDVQNFCHTSSDICDNDDYGNWSQKHWKINTDKRKFNLYCNLLKSIDRIVDNYRGNLNINNHEMKIQCIFEKRDISVPEGIWHVNFLGVQFKGSKFLIAHGDTNEYKRDTLVYSIIECLKKVKEEVEEVDDFKTILLKSFINIANIF
jgi:hypothetical protein